VDAEEFEEFRKAFDFDEFEFQLSGEEEKGDEICEEEEGVFAWLRVEVKRTDREDECLLVVVPAERTGEFKNGKLRLEQLLAPHRVASI